MAGSLIKGNSDLLAGPLGNVFIGFDGYLLGKTTDDTAFNKDEDVKDIVYSQDGTKPSDHVSTGHLKMLSATFGEISTELLKKVLYSFTSKATPGSGNDSGSFERYIYKSLRDNKAKPMRIWATDPNGSIIEDDQSVLNFYEVVPLVQENIINWGADTQRNLSVEFMIYFHTFGQDAVVGGSSGGFGYYGDPVQEKVPATDWVDGGGPILLSAEATTATNVDVTFDKNIALQGGSYTGGIIVKVDGLWVVPTGVSVATAVASVTLPAASVAAGQEVEVSITNVVIEDTETSPNIFTGANDQIVVNSVP